MAGMTIGVTTKMATDMAARMIGMATRMTARMIGMATGMIGMATGMIGMATGMIGMATGMTARMIGMATGMTTGVATGVIIMAARMSAMRRMVCLPTVSLSCGRWTKNSPPYCQTYSQLNSIFFANLSFFASQKSLNVLFY